LPLEKAELEIKIVLYFENDPPEFIATNILDTFRNKLRSGAFRNGQTENSFSAKNAIIQIWSCSIYYSTLLRLKISTKNLSLIFANSELRHAPDGILSGKRILRSRKTRMIPVDRVVVRCVVKQDSTESIRIISKRYTNRINYISRDHFSVV
jgi:hypothetical protein